MRGLAAGCVLATILAGAPKALVAQEVEIRAVPSVGWFLPTSLLYRSDLPPARGELERAPILGLGVHALMDGLPVSLRVTGERIARLNTEVTGLVPRPGVPEEEWETMRFTVPTTVTTVTGDLLVHPGRGELRSTAYVFAGFGWKSYSFGEEEPPDDVGYNFPEDGSSGRLHYGAGIEVPVGPIGFAPEVSGNFNRFVLVDEEQGISRSHSQHEFALTLRGYVRLFSF